MHCLPSLNSLASPSHPCFGSVALQILSYLSGANILSSLCRPGQELCCRKAACVTALRRALSDAS